ERTQTRCEAGTPALQNGANEPRPGRDARTHRAPKPRERTQTRSEPEYPRPKTARTNPTMGALGKLCQEPNAGVQDQPGTRSKRRERTQCESGEICQNMIFTAIKKDPAILSIDGQPPILVHSRSHGRGGRDPETVNHPASVEHPESRSRWGRDGKDQRC